MERCAIPGRHIRSVADGIRPPAALIVEGAGGDGYAELVQRI